MEKSEAIRRAGIAVYEALNRHDNDVIKHYFDSGPEHLTVGTAAAEVWHGGDVVAQNFAEQFRQMPDLRFTPGDIRAFAAGDVGGSSTSPPWTVRACPRAQRA